MAQEDESDVKAPLVTWIGLIAGSAISFWAQAVVTEERFVPSLNVLATHFDISDDVAGATLMAAGASSPELLASFTTLFITHSSLGFGTIVGSEIFNQLVICAGSILAARNKQLHLDRAIVLREVFFYGLSLAFLLIALSDRREVDDSGFKHIFISWHDGLLLVAGYVAYVLVCAYFERVIGFLNARLGYRKDVVVDATHLSTLVEEGPETPSINLALPFLRLVSREPRTNFHLSNSLIDEIGTEEEEELSPSHSYDDEHNAESAMTSHEGRVAHMFKYFVARTKPQPSTIHGLEEIVRDESNDTVSCFLWERSLFYNKTRVDINAWQLRWFTFHRDGITSVPNRTYCTQQIRYPTFDRIDVDEAHLVVKMFSLGTGTRNYIFMAPSSAVLKCVLDSCQHIPAESDETLTAEPQNAYGELRPSLVTFPTGSSCVTQFFHVTLFPIKLLMHVTVPDSRLVTDSQQGLRIRTAALAIFSCIAWLVVGSYAMVAFLERLGALMRVPDDVIGVTVSAAGTSLPNYVASQVAARQGLGNMAVSNAFGSNTFNIFVGLGLPWALRTVIIGEYSELRDDGITESVFVLVAVLLAFIALIFCSNFVLYQWHAYVFFLVYAAYVISAVAQTYL